MKASYYLRKSNKEGIFIILFRHNIDIAFFNKNKKTEYNFFKELKTRIINEFKKNHSDIGYLYNSNNLTNLLCEYVK